MASGREPVILFSNRNLINSVKPGAAGVGGGASQLLRLKAGILRFSEDGAGGDELNEGSHLVGVSISILKRLSVTSGSLVVVKNAETNIGRIVKVLVLDRPILDMTEEEGTNEMTFPSHPRRVMNILPSFMHSSDNNIHMDQEVAYLTPILAFNLGLHMLCLKILVQGGQESLKSLFEVEGHQTVEKGILNSSLHVQLVPMLHMPRYASHLRISFVRIPECGMLESLKENSKIELEDRQSVIDSVLNEYFKVDRFMARGDVFCINIDWNCGSETCITCSCQAPQKLSDNQIYFKVVAMEPLNESILRVNCNQTALVLGGTVASAIPPDLFVSNSSQFSPLQADAVKLLASVLAPTLCPSALSSKFRVAVFLFGPTGCGKRTVARYVAHRLGLHVVEYSCHDLMAYFRKEGICFTCEYLQGCS